MGSLSVVIGGSRAARDAALAARIEAAGSRVAVCESCAAAWPFARRAGEGVPDGPVAVAVPGLEDAFPAGQTGGRGSC